MVMRRRAGDRKPPPEKIQQTIPTTELLGISDEHVEPFMASVVRAGGLPLPKDMPVIDLLQMVRLVQNKDNRTEKFYRERIRSPLTAVRAFCVSCNGWQPGQANSCENMDCPLWLFRFGKNPFFNKSIS